MATSRDLDALLDAFVRRGDASAMEEIVARTRSRLLAVARRIGQAQDAEDTVQAAYHALLRKPAGLGDAPVFPWLLATSVRIAYRRKAVQARQHALAQRLDRARIQTSAVDGLLRAERDASLRGAIAKLPARYRDAVVLHHLEGLKTAEIARLMGVTRSTVTTRLHRGRALLRRGLSPRLVHALLIVPWLLKDAAQAATVPVLAGVGGIMQAKAAVAFSVLTLTAGAMGYGVATLSAEDAPTRPRRTLADAEIRQLETKLATAEAEVDALRQQLEGSAEPSVRAAALKSDAAERTPSDPENKRLKKAKEQGFPLRLWEEAKGLDVSPRVLRVALRAIRALGTADATAFDAIRELRAFEEEGFRAAVALLRSGHLGQPIDLLLQKTYRPEFEKHLLDTASAEGVSKPKQSAALYALRVADTQEVRDALVARIEIEENRSVAWYVVLALAHLKEPRGAAGVERMLLSDDPLENEVWDRSRQGLLANVSRMGGEGAFAVLRNFVRDHRAIRGTDLVQAFNGLWGIDRHGCRELALAFRQDPRHAGLSGAQQERIRVFAGVPKGPG